LVLARALSALLLAILLLGNAGAGFAAGDSASSGQSPIRIGFIVPLTGAAAANGQAMVDGFNLYLDECHHKMGGRAVQFLVEDDGCNPATGVGKVYKLVNDEKVHVLSGQYLANVLYKVAPVANSLGI